MWGEIVRLRTCEGQNLCLWFYKSWHLLSCKTSVIKTSSLLLSAQTLHRGHPDVSVPLCGGSDRHWLWHTGWHLEHRLHGGASTCTYDLHLSLKMCNSSVARYRCVTSIFCPSMCSVGFRAGHRGLSVRPPIRSHILPRGRFVFFTTSLLSLIRLNVLIILHLLVFSQITLPTSSSC